MFEAYPVDSTALYGRLPVFVEQTGRVLFEELKLTARNLARSLAYSTQPYGLGRGSEQMGRAAVGRDVGRVFATPSSFYEALEDSDPTLAPMFWQAYKDRDLTGMQEIAERSRAGAGLEILTRPDAEVHAARRGHRGRVAGKRRSALVLQPERLEAYRREVQHRVGLTKSGFAQAAEAAGGSGGFPAWAGARHARATGGAELDPTPTRPQVTIRNDVPWVSEALPEREEQTAIDIAQDRLLIRLEKILAYETESPF